MSRWASLVLAIGLPTVACGDPAPAAPPTAPVAPVTAAPPTQACQTDADCTGDWTPDQQGCATANRCYAGACIEPPAMTGVVNDQTGRLVFEGTPEHTFEVELAREPFETQRGLMCRRSMKPDWGMVFFMRATRPQRFWMFNTLISLDLVFLDDTWNVVGVVENAPPLTLDGRGVAQPSRYVLELVGGATRKAGIVAGSKARFYPPRAGL